MKHTLGSQHIGVYWSIITGLLAGILIGIATEYYTSSRYSPTKGIAQASATGAATVIISGISVGMLSTMIPVITVGAAILASFICLEAPRISIWVFTGLPSRQWACFLL